jgi:hypothetical protein
MIDISPDSMGWKVELFELCLSKKRVDLLPHGNLVGHLKNVVVLDHDCQITLL